MAIDIVSEIAVRLGLDTDGLANDVKSTNKVIKELNKEFKYLDKGAKGSQNELDRLGEITKVLSSKLDVTKNALKQVQNTIESTQSEIQRLTQEKKELIAQGNTESAMYKEIENKLKEYTLALEQNKKEAIQLNGVIGTTEKQLNKFSSEFDRTKQALDVFGKVAEETGQDVKELARQLDIDIDVSDYRQLENALRDIKQNSQELSNETKQLIDNITNMGNRFRNSSRDVDRMNQSLEEVSRNTRLDAISDGVDTLADTFGDVGRSIVDFGKESVTSFAEFEQTVVGAVMKTDNGLKDLDKSMEGLQELGAKFPITNQELATSFDDLSASGFSANQSLEILEGSLNTSRATGEELEAIVSATSSSYAIFGDQVKNVAELQDIMANAANLGKISVEELGKQLTKVGGNANNLGMDIEEVSAVLAELTNEGLSAEASGEKLNSMLRQLANPSKNAKGLLKELNVEIFDSKGNFRGFTTVMDELNKSTKDMSQEQKNLAMNTLFGADASSAASTYMEKGIDTTNQYSESLKNTTGYVDELTGAIKENAETASSIEQLEATFDSLKATVGEALAPVLNTLLPMVTNLVQAFVDADPVIQNIIIGIGAFVGVLGVVLGALAPIIFSITSLVTLFGGLSGIIGVVAGAFAFLTSPIGLIATAITALVATTAYLATNWDEFSSFVQETWNKILGYITTKIDEIKTSLKEGLGRIQSDLSNTWNQIATEVSTAWSNIKSKISDKIDEIKTTFKTGFGRIQSDLQNTWNQITSEVSTAWSNIKTKVKTGVDNVKTTIKSVFDTLESIMTAPFRTAKKVIDGILGGIGKGISAVTNGISKVTSGKGKSIDMPITMSDETTPIDMPNFYENLENSQAYLRNMKTTSISESADRMANSLTTTTSLVSMIDTLKQQNKLLIELVSNTNGIGDLGNMQQDINVNVDGRTIAKATAKYIQPELKTLESRAIRLGGIL